MSQTPDSGDVEYESIALRSDQVVVARDDLLHCLQVAVWRAGLLDGVVSGRLMRALGIPRVPRPSPVIRVPQDSTMTRALGGLHTYELPEPITGPGLYEIDFDVSAGRVAGVRKIGD
jgi:hypothetical protein